MSEANQIAALARWAKPGERERASNYLKGDPRLRSNLGRKDTAETTRKRSESAKKRGPRVWTEASRKKNSETSKRRWLDPAYREKMANAFRGKASTLELKMKALLDAAGVDYVHQYPVPGTRYVADFYLPRTNAVVEVDGARWHAKRTERDARRDAKIRALGFRVVRLSAARVKPGVELEIVS